MTILEANPRLSRRFYPASYFAWYFGISRTSVYAWLATAEEHGAVRIGRKGSWKWREDTVIQALQEAWD